MNIILDNRKIKGVVIINIPMITNTPRPPWNLRKKDQLWPNIEVNAGTEINQVFESKPRTWMVNQTGKDPLSITSNIIMGIALASPQLKARLLAPMFRLPTFLRSTFRSVPMM